MCATIGDRYIMADRMEFHVSEKVGGYAGRPVAAARPESRQDIQVNFT